VLTPTSWTAFLPVRSSIPAGTAGRDIFPPDVKKRFKIQSVSGGSILGSSQFTLQPNVQIATAPAASKMFNFKVVKVDLKKIILLH